MKSHFSLRTVLSNNQKAPKEILDEVYFFLCVFWSHFGGGEKNVTVLFTLLVFKTKDQKKCLENIISV